jgi:hypothetical protein
MSLNLITILEREQEQRSLADGRGFAFFGTS